MSPLSINRYKHHRFPSEISSHGVWLYFRFCLSYRDVEELLFVRGGTVTYEAIRQWCRKFGQAHANHERRMQGFKSAGQAQRFLAAYGPIMEHFRPRRHLLPASVYRQEMRQRLRTWQELTSVSTAV
jgi:transposase-like protein